IILARILPAPDQKATAGGERDDDQAVPRAPETPGDNFRFAAPSRSDYFASFMRQFSSTCFLASAKTSSSPKKYPPAPFYSFQVPPRHDDYFPNSAPPSHFYRPVFGPFCNGHKGEPDHAPTRRKSKA